jgi:site-specific recombinase XerD
MGKHGAYWLEQYMCGIRPKLTKDRIDEQALWLGLSGKPVTGGSVAAMMRRCGKQAKLPMNITPHTLRRSCVTHMLRHGAHPVQLQLMLGHTGMKHLSQYLHLSITEIKQMHKKANPGK